MPGEIPKKPSPAVAEALLIKMRGCMILSDHYGYAIASIDYLGECIPLIRYYKAMLPYWSGLQLESEKKRLTKLLFLTLGLIGLTAKILEDTYVTPAYHTKFFELSEEYKTLIA